MCQHIHGFAEKYNIYVDNWVATELMLATTKASNTAGHIFALNKDYLNWS